MKDRRRTIPFLHFALGLGVALVPLACGEDIITIEFPDSDGGVDAGAGGDGDGGPNDGGDTGQDCAGQCAPLTPLHWSEPVLLWSGPASSKPTACPAEAPTLYYEGYADIAASNDCPLCTCDDPACELPAGLVASESNLCQGPTLTPFDAPQGWDGSCASPASIPSNLLASIVIQPPTVSACKPGIKPMPTAMPSPLWQAAALACRGEAYGKCDGSGMKCVPAAGDDAPGFAVCVAYLKDDDAACPPGYDDKRTYYESYVDNRMCSPCACDPPVGSDCAAMISAYSGDGCTSPISSNLVELTGALCSGVAPGKELRGMSAQWVANVPGSCMPSGGEPSGEVMPTQPTIFCCAPPTK